MGAHYDATGLVLSKARQEEKKGVRVMKQLFGCLLIVFAIACGSKDVRPPASTSPGPRPMTTEPLQQPTQQRSTPGPVTIQPEEDDLTAMEDLYGINSRSLEDLKADSPLEDVNFEFDSAALSDRAREILEHHADVMSRYPGLTILIEGHCDERGTVDYNLALGERRATAVFNYLSTLGAETSRMKTISYGKEFPLDPGHNEAAWELNRRGNFEITGK